MTFRPEPNEEIAIGDTTYRIAEHPAAPGMPYGQEGRAAVVYQLLAGNKQRALKVFKSRFRTPSLVALAGRVAAFADLPGLSVCLRTVLTPQQHSALLRKQPDLIYSMLMPWIEGPTWMEVLLDKRDLSPEQSLSLARSLVEVLASMEARGLAHCDISGPNLLIPALAAAPRYGSQFPVELVDVEQLYGLGLGKPEVLPGGSQGYAHKTAPQGLWEPEADRFAGAVLLAEMLGWCDEPVRGAAWGENYFDPDELQKPSARYDLLMKVLRERWGNAVPRLFEQAWDSATLEDCPSFAQWQQALHETSTQPAGDASATAAGGEMAALAATAAAAADPIAANAVDSPESPRGMLDQLTASGRELEAHGNIREALASYREARSIAPEGSPAAQDLASRIEALERKQAAEQPPRAVDAVAPATEPGKPTASEAATPAAPAVLPVVPVVTPAAAASQGATLPVEPAGATQPAQITPPTPHSQGGGQAPAQGQGQWTQPQGAWSPTQPGPPPPGAGYMGPTQAPTQPSPVMPGGQQPVYGPPPANPYIGRMFDDSLAAYRRGDWITADRLLRQVVSSQPAYSKDGYLAATVLMDVERRLQTAPPAQPVYAGAAAVAVAPPKPPAPGTANVNRQGSGRNMVWLIPAVLVLCLLVAGGGFAAYQVLGMGPRPSPTATLGAIIPVITGGTFTPTPAEEPWSPTPDMQATLGVLVPTDTAVPVPTDTEAPADTPVPTDTAAPVPPTDTTVPVVPTDTVPPPPTDTPVPPPTNTPVPVVPPTNTRVALPTHTPLPTRPAPTRTFTPRPAPTNTRLPVRPTNTPAAPAFTVTLLAASVDPANSTRCPTTFNFTGIIRTNGAGVVTYHWERSDGTVFPPETLYFASGGTQSVSLSWEVSASYRGWVRLVVERPNSMTSNQASFVLSCQ